MRVQATQTSSAGFATTFWHDFAASIVVFLVALPLCMGIAIASGAPVSAGLITGIVGGLVVGVLAGSPLQVSGPAAGLTVIVYDLIQTHGLEMLGLAVLIGGALQLLAGAFRWGQWFRAVSPAVIKGMLSGIGVLIFASQFHVMVDDKPKGSGIENLISIPQAVAKGLSIPEPHTREQRRIRTQMLKQLGELHRRQVDIRGRIAESVADGSGVVSPGPGAAGLQTPQQTPAARRPANAEGTAKPLSQWEQQQAEVLEQLEVLAANLRNFHPPDNGEKARQIRASAPKAVSAAQAALHEIQAGNIDAALASQSAAVEALEDLLGQLKNHGWAAIVGVLTIVLILLWQGLVPRHFRVVPAPLVAIVLVTVLAAVSLLPVIYVEIPDNLFNDVRLPTLSLLKDVPWMALLQGGVVLAIIASAETLLCATAVDQMHAGPRTRYDRELMAQGAGNVICGLLGALPMTGVIVRSSANVQAGARTRWSAVMHGLWLLLFVSVLAGLLRFVPTASLAAILVYTGYKLINVKAIRELWEYGKGEVVIYLATVGTIVATDLLTGVITGVVLSGVKLLYTFSHLKIQLRTDLPTQALSPEGEGPGGGRVSVLSLEGAATFVRLPKLAAKLEQVPPYTELHVDLQHLDYIDHACLDLLMNWAKQHEATGGKLFVDWGSMHAKFRREPIRRERSLARRIA